MQKIMVNNDEHFHNIGIYFYYVEKASVPLRAEPYLHIPLRPPVPLGPPCSSGRAPLWRARTPGPGSGPESVAARAETQR